MTASFLTQPILAILLLLGIHSGALAKSASCPIDDTLELRRLHSQETQNLCQILTSENPLLIVNTASKCGYTDQLGDLEKLHQKYKSQGLVILGFPSDSFNQEEQQEEDTARVCFKNFGVTFLMFEPVAVTGENAHVLFKYLAQKTQFPAWNFNKYVMHKDHIEHFDSRTTPLESALEKAIQKALSSL